MMTRNTEHRVDCLPGAQSCAEPFPVQRYVKAQLKDNVKAFALSPSGEWMPVMRGCG